MTLSLATGTLLGGIASGLMQGIGGYLGGTQSADLSAKIAKENTEKQLAWERERATTAHQWETQDLEKAGLNPILSAGGSGAVTGGISPQLPDTSGINSAYSALGNMGMNIIDIVTNAAEKQATAQQAMSNAKLLDNKKFTEDTLQILNMYNAGLIKKNTAIAEIKKQQEQINLDWAETEKWINNATKVATPIIQGLGMFGIGKMLKGGKLKNIVNKRTGEIKTFKQTKKGNWIELEVPKVH